MRGEIGDGYHAQLIGSFHPPNPERNGGRGESEIFGDLLVGCTTADA